MKVVLQPKRINQLTGLDLIILEPDASLQDLIDAMQPFAGWHGGLYKLQLRGPGECRGCSNSCCSTSPIAPDPIGFAAIRGAHGLTNAELLARYCDPDDRARGLVRFRSYPCTFLSPDGLCTVYEHRPLVCRLFICCTLSPALENLIHNGLGAGLAALSRQMAPLAPPGAIISRGGQVGSKQAAEFDRFHRLWVRGIMTEGDELPPAWHRNPFADAAAYAEIPLWSLVTAGDWSELTRRTLPYPGALGSYPTTVT